MNSNVKKTYHTSLASKRRKSKHSLDSFRINISQDNAVNRGVARNLIWVGINVN